MLCPTTSTYCAMLCTTTATYCTMLCPTAQQHSSAVPVQYLTVSLSFPSVVVSHLKWILMTRPLCTASLSVREEFKTLIILSVCRFTSLLTHHQTEFLLHSQYETTGPLFHWTCPVGTPQTTCCRRRSSGEIHISSACLRRWSSCSVKRSQDLAYLLHGAESFLRS